MTAYVPATTAHHNFICNAWIESFRDSPAAGIIAKERWRAVMWPEVERIMARRDAHTVVAVNDNDHGVYRGFACVDTAEWPPVVFFAYVKQALRRTGLATEMLAAAGVDVTRPYRYTCKTTPVIRMLDAAREACDRDSIEVTERREQEDGTMAIVKRYTEPRPIDARTLKLMHLVSMAKFEPDIARTTKETP